MNEICRDVQFPLHEVPDFLIGLEGLGFRMVTMSAGKDEVWQAWEDLSGNAIRVLVARGLVEVEADYPAGPILRDRG